MYLRILKKDLKRKKTMNCILLLFVILSVMFASSSVNNIVAVLNGLDYFFAKAGMTDYYYIAAETDGVDALSEILDNEASVLDYKKEEVVYCTSDNFRQDGETFMEFSNAAILMSIQNAKLNYFDSDNDPIQTVEPGTVYISSSLAEKSNLKPNDTFQVQIGEVSCSLTFAGIAKDAFLGADMIGNPRFLLSETDYDKICADNTTRSSHMGGIYYVNTSDMKQMESAVADQISPMFTCSVSTIKMAYVVNTIVACLLLIVSVCLILVSFVVLRFTIGFTIAEEFREIGVMKAIGIPNSAIRCLYLVKYLGISILGAAAGYIGSIPFGNMMLASVSKNIVLGNDHSLLIRISCSIAVIVIMMLFCWSCTRKIKKMSPIDAVRNGQTGERFRRKSLIHLGKSKLGTAGFLPLNDVLSSPKQYGIITAVFTICMLLIMILANTANTLNSEKLLFLLGSVKSDVYYSNSSQMMSVMGGSKTLDEVFADIEHTLEEQDMPGTVHVETMYQIPVTSDTAKCNLIFQQCKDTRADAYTYSTGSPPQNANEIALSELAAEELGVQIGDTITLTIDGKNDSYMVTALFQSMNQMGKNGRLQESVDIPETDIASAFSFQIDFNDNPDKREIDRRIETLKDVFDTDQIWNAEGFVKDCTGAADTINSVKNLVLLIAIVITALISVLMERAFLTKEQGEIALMKALGFPNRSIIAQHTLRFVLVGMTAAILAGIFCIPLTVLTIDPVFGMMGAINGVSYEVKPLEIFVCYPLILLAVTALSALLTACYTKTIQASDTSDIE